MAHPNFAEAIKPSYLDAIANASVVSATMGDTNLVVKNRGGATVADLLIKDPDSAYVERVVQLYSYDLGIRYALIADWTCQFYNNDTVTGIAGAGSAGKPTAMAWSPDGVYLAVGSNASPYIEVFKRSGDLVTKLTPALTSPGSMVLSVAWSGDGQYLFTGQINGPFLAIYKRSGDTFTMLSTPSTMPPGYVNSLSCSFGAYSDILSVGMGVYPYIYNYAVVGDTLTILAEPEFLPSQDVSDLEWSPTGTYLAAVDLDSNQSVFIYKRTTDLTLTKLPDLADIGPAGSGQTIAWSANEKYLAFAGGPYGIGDPVFYVYKRSGDTFTKLVNPVDPPLGSVVSLDWSPDSRYLAVSFSASPYLAVYQVVNDVLVRMPDIRTAPIAAGILAWSPIGKTLLMSTSLVWNTYKSMMGPISGAAIRMQVGDG